jgi:hypothetical protein
MQISPHLEFFFGRFVVAVVGKSNPSSDGIQKAVCYSRGKWTVVVLGLHECAAEENFDVIDITAIACAYISVSRIDVEASKSLVQEEVEPENR